MRTLQEVGSRGAVIASNRRPSGGEHRVSSFESKESLASRSPRLATRAFTLTELLVVITIIAILASLITAGAMSAMRAGRRTAITNQIKQLESSTEEFKNKYGLYPPNGMNVIDDETPNGAGNPIYDQTINDFIRSFRKAFPRHKEPEGLLRRLAGDLSAPNQLDGMPSVLSNVDGDRVGGGLTAAEAVYFWLGGFSDDAVYPISGAGGPSFADTNSPSGLDPGDEILENRTVFFEFDLTQLGPRNEDGIFDERKGRFVTYRVSINGGPLHERRINFWTYKPKGQESEFVYFDASRHDPEDYDMNLAGDLPTQPTEKTLLFAVKKLREGFNTSQIPTVKDIHFVNKNRFQILHPGLDDTWGDFSFFDISTANDGDDASNIMVFPTGPFTGDIADTLTNFTDGTLESAQE